MKKYKELIHKEDFNPFNLSFDSVHEEEDFCLFLGELFPLFDSSQTYSNAPHWLKKGISTADEVSIYPGSFNPWHLGHRACLDLCPEKNIIIVPDSNPWKERADNYRPWEFLKDLLYRLSETDYCVYPGFVSKKEGNPTVDWFPKIPVSKKNLLLGDDSFLNFHKWKDVEVLVNSISKLYVVPRGADGNSLEIQRERFPKLEVIFLDHHEHEELSSTKLREQ